ncbi:hypothetical protein M5K25_027884 [Dendrobium thyrsiflorum]|uniref:U1-type domain-containing protein n=1 Tax=Dendrobium thyrsiflorum TaxID=117978 RepID=A0ABD0TV39_DENTH
MWSGWKALGRSRREEMEARAGFGLGCWCRIEERDRGWTTTSNVKLSGAKRKAQGELLIQAEKQWGCALCKVTSSSEEALKEHLQGRKHKAKEALLVSTKKTGLLQSKQNVSPPLEGAPAGPPVKKKQQKLWCGLCKVKCNSSIMLEYHLAGRKHRNFMELRKANFSFKTGAVKTISNEKLGDSGSGSGSAGLIKEELETGCPSTASGSVGV